MMASRPPNQATGQGYAGGNLANDNKSRPVPKGKVKTGGKKPPAGKPNLTKPNGAGLYSWGGAYTHTIPKAQHQQNIQPLDAPLTYGGAMREANAAADLQYGPQIAAAQQQVTNTPVWFNNFLAQVAGYKTAAQQQYQPVLDQAATMAAPATNPQAAQAQLPQGLDPNSAAGQQALLAAQGRGQLASLGQQALTANATSAGDYMSALQAAALAQQPGAMTAAQNALASAQSQRGLAVSKNLSDARTNAQNYSIAQGTLGLNTVKAQQDAADKHNARVVSRKNTRDRIQAQQDAAGQRAKAKGETVNKYGYTNEQWARFSPSHRQRIMQSQKGSGGTDKTAEKHAKDITTATGKVQNTVQDIIDGYNSYRGKTTDDTSKPKDPKTGQYPARPLTDADIRAILGQNKNFTPQLIHIALMRRQGKKLGAAEVRYLHNLDPNVRIPRDWLQQERGAQGSGGNAPAEGGSRPT